MKRREKELERETKREKETQVDAGFESETRGSQTRKLASRESQTREKQTRGLRCKNGKRGNSRREIRVARMANAGITDARIALQECHKRGARGLRLSQGMRMRTRG